jgi:biotin carboxyl carrier protein
LKIIYIKNNNYGGNTMKFFKNSEKSSKATAAVNGLDYTVLSPMPGGIVEILIKEGDSVKADDTLLILEAMKMENEIKSPIDGVITSVSVKKGDHVEAGDKLIVIG